MIAINGPRVFCVEDTRPSRADVNDTIIFIVPNLSGSSTVESWCSQERKSNPSSSGVGQRPVNPDEILGGVWPETANRRRHKIGHETRQHVFARTWTNETAYSIRVGCGYVCVD